MAGFMMAGTPLLAQDDWGSCKSTTSLTVGPEFLAGASMTQDPPEFYKVGPVFAWRGGAEMFYPLTPIIGAGFGLGLDSRGTKLRQYDNSDFYTITHINYFSIFPSFEPARP